MHSPLYTSQLEQQIKHTGYSFKNKFKALEVGRWNHQREHRQPRAEVNSLAKETPTQNALFYEETENHCPPHHLPLAQP